MSGRLDRIFFPNAADSGHSPAERTHDDRRGTRDSCDVLNRRPACRSFRPSLADRPAARESGMTKRSGSKPPVAIHQCLVEQYAIRPRGLPFTGHGLLFSGGEEVGPVPRLALARERSGHVLLLFCDARWNSLGASGSYRTLRDAKRLAERFYPGISRAWIPTRYTKSQARRYIERTGANQRCAVCRKPWFDVEQIVEIKRRKLVICGGCIRELYALVSDPGATPRGDVR